MPDHRVLKYISALTGCFSSKGEPVEGLTEETTISNYGPPRAASRARVCKHCLKFEFNPDAHVPFGAREPLFLTFGQITKSAATCSVCELVLGGLKHGAFNFSGPLENRVSDNHGIFIGIWRWQNEKETTVSFFMTAERGGTETPDRSWPRLTEINLRVYLEDEGQMVKNHLSGRRRKNKGDVWARAPPLRAWSDPCIHLLNKWLNDCLERHKEKGCLTTISGQKVDESIPPTLPTRVIDVGPSDGSGSARLLQANGACGHYVALSYRWGSSQKSERPYLTTTQTLESHISCLPWDLLPKTLQDAIVLTRAVGLRYLWIDSLCIIQDSTDDWEQEAARMGTVYAQARLVIAASAGTDADVGLFPCQSYTPCHRPGQPSLYFRELQPPYRVNPPYLLPLFTRGWATQEWVLARRTVFWTEERMCWRCMCQCLQDDGETIGDASEPGSFTKYNSDLFDRYPSWMEIVKLYSRRDLTYPSDKLVALQGIANEIHKRRPKDQYTFGSWRSNMPWELLWSGQKDRSVDPELESWHIPSWSWAAHPGGVRFMGDPEKNQKIVSYYQKTPSRAGQAFVEILEDLSVQIVARAKIMDLHEPGIGEYCFRWHRFEHGYCHIEFRQGDKKIASPFQNPSSMLSLFCPNDIGPGVLQYARHHQRVLVVFDITDFLCTYRQEPSSLGDVDDTSNEFMFVALVETDSKEPEWFPRSNQPYGSDYDIRTTGEYTHPDCVGLLLRKSHRTPGKYIRVGVGLASPVWFQDAEMGEFIVE